MPFDCELVGEGLIAQPVNTFSSLAFVVGAMLVWRSHRLAAAALLTVGVGSVLFHGTPSTFSSVVHDVGLSAVIVVVVVELWKRRANPPLVALALLGVGLVVWWGTRTGGPWCRPESLLQGHAAWHVISAVAVVLIVSDRSIPRARRRRP